MHWTYSYGPIDDPLAPTGVGGVLVVCTETTETVLANRRLALEREHFSQMFAQAPSFMAMLRGPEPRFEMANAAYIRFLNGREVVCQTVAEALPEAAEQGYVALLDEVYATGQPYNATGCKFVFRTAPGGPLAERYVDFVYQPIKEPDGRVRGIFVQGVDMTQRTLAERAEAELAG